MAPTVVHIVAARRVGFPRAVALGVALTVVAVLALSVLASPELGWLFGGYLAVLFASLGLNLARTNPWPEPRDGAVSVRDGALYVGGKRVVGTVARATSLLRRDGRRVVRVERSLRGASWPVDIEVLDEDSERALLTALGHAPEQRAAEFWLVSPARRATRWRPEPALAVVFGAALVFGALSVWLGAFFAALALSAAASVAVVVRATPSRARVAPDGLHERWLGRHTFLPMSAIAEVLLEPDGFTVVRTDGPDFVVRLGSRWISSAERLEAQLAGARLLAAFEAFQRYRATGPISSLAHHGAAPESELERLRALTHPTARGYRERSIEPTLLWSVVENPQGDAWQRAAAAVALGPALDPTGRQRLRALAEGSAAPGVRVVLSSVADGAPDAQLSGALAELAKATEDSSKRSSGR